MVLSGSALKPNGRSYRTTTSSLFSRTGGSLTSAVPISAIPFLGISKENSKSGRCSKRASARDMDGVRRLVLTKPLAIGSASKLNDMDKRAKDFIVSSVQCVILVSQRDSRLVVLFFFA
eukprot:scaffold891_cov89-Skeletonema_dohrnii-CCMP3373.AAC.4